MVIDLTTQQRALAAAIERMKLAAERERRDLTMDEIAQIDALTAAVATLTRAINLDTHVAASAASAGAYRAHAARGPPRSGEGNSILRWRAVSKIGSASCRAR